MARVLRWLVLCGGSGFAVADRWLGSVVARALRWLGSVWNDLLIKGGWVGSVGDGSGSAVALALRWLALRWLGFSVCGLCNGLTH